MIKNWVSKDWSWQQLVLPFVLVAALLINKTVIQPPSPKNEVYNLTAFSASRAMEHVRRIAVEPHPVGTPANARVRLELVKMLEQAGLETEVQSTQIVDSYTTQGDRHQTGRPWHRHSAAHVNNVIGLLKGSDPAGKALMLMSHYDSVYYGPGAGDDAAGTATLLEVLRALKEGGPLKNDIIFLITDAEEVGLFGAQAFFEKHRWADDVGLVLNFEARGSRGPVSMFQTSDPNNRLIEIFSKTVERPLANSLTVTIYKNMPNDTDMSISLNHGIPGMNFAFIEGFYDYHTKGDNADNLSLATLQHMGDQALAVTKVMGNQPLPLEDTSERVFFDILTLFLVSYPLWASWLVAATAISVLVLFARKKLLAGVLKISGLLRGMSGALLFILVFALVVDLLYLMIGGRSGDMVESRRLFALANEQLLAFTLIGLSIALAWFRMVGRGFSLLWVGAGILLSFLLLIYETSWIPAFATLILTGVSYIILRHPVDADERLLASLDTYLLVALILHILAPAGSHLFFWPFILLVMGLYLENGLKSKLLFLGLSALPASLWLGYYTEMGYSALGISFPSIIAVPFGLLLLLLVPAFLHSIRNSHHTVMAITGVIGVGLVFYAGIAPGFNERFNQPTEVFYLVNSTAKASGEANEPANTQSYYASGLKAPDNWSSLLMTGETKKQPISSVVPRRRGMLTLAAAPASDVLPVTIEENTVSATLKHFTLRPGYRGDVMLVSLASTAPLSQIVVNGDSLGEAKTPGSSIILSYFAVPAEGLSMQVYTKGQLTIHATEITSDWPEDIKALIPPKPAAIMRAPYRFSDSTVSTLKHTIAKHQSPVL